MDILGIGYLGFESTSPQAWAEYGPHVLGAPLGAPNPAAPDTVYLRLDDSDYRMAFHPGPIDKIAYIGWEVAGRDEFKACLQQFEKHDVEFELGDPEICALRGVRAMARFRDPVGYQHELFYSLRSQPGSFLPARPYAGFDVGDKGCGHIVLASPDSLERIDHFFQDVLGMRFTTHGFFKVGVASFFTPKLNPRSHCIAFAHMPGKMGIYHHGLPVSSMDGLGVMYDIVKKREGALQATLGRHTQDPVISFYHFTPGGMMMECLYEERPWIDLSPRQINAHTLSIWGHEQVAPHTSATVRDIAQMR